MNLTGALCLLSFFMALRMMGFRFFRPTVCPRCQMEETTARQELWRILNSTSGAVPPQCINGQQVVDSEDEGEDEGDDSQSESHTTEDQSEVIGQMLSELKKNTEELRVNP